jgi:hypothetical protein
MKTVPNICKVKDKFAKFVLISDEHAPNNSTKYKITANKPPLEDVVLEWLGQGHSCSYNARRPEMKTAANTRGNHRKKHFKAFKCFRGLC